MFHLNHTMLRSIVELPDLSNLYRLSEKDFDKANTSLIKAFKKDPIWNRALERFPEKYQYLFGVPLKYTLYYGKGYAPSENIEGVALWLGSPYMDMSIFRIIRCRSLRLGLKIGLKAGKVIMEAFDIVEKDRHTNMKGQSYVYLSTLGIDPSYQRQKHGYNLVKSMLDALPHKIPVYLETATEGNVKFYENLGFKVIKEIIIPQYDLPMWELIFKK